MHENENLLQVLGNWWAKRQKERSTALSSHPEGVRKWLPTRGNVLFTMVMIGVLLWAQSAWAVPFNSTNAASTGTIAYQGRLANAGGAPLTQTIGMEFRLYSAATGGTPLWTEQWTGSNSVQVSDGLFNVMLGSLTPIPPSVVAGNSNLFLGITVGTDDEMSPRVQLGSVPTAIQALTVPNGSITTTKLADGSITSSKLSADLNLNAVEASKVVNSNNVYISTSPSDMVSKPLIISKPSSVLILLNTRAIWSDGQDSEVVFSIFRDGQDLASNIHWSVYQGTWHQYFSFSFLDTNLAPGTYTYTVKAYLLHGSGTRQIHQPTISTVVIPN